MKTETMRIWNALEDLPAGTPGDFAEQVRQVVLKFGSERHFEGYGEGYDAGLDVGEEL